MARLPAGTLPTPAKDRLKRYGSELKDRGGKRLVVDLEPEAKLALEAAQRRTGKSLKDVVAAALISFGQAPH